MKSWIYAAACAALLVPAAQAQELVYWDEVGGWDILVDPSLGNGCLIQAEFTNGVLVRIGFDPDAGGGYVTAFHDNWGDIIEGETYDIGFDLDGQEYLGVARGMYLDGVPGADIMFDNPDFLFDIAARQTMTLFNENGEVMSIDLTGTMVALDATLDCQEQQG